MPETIYNLFLMFCDGLCREIRYATHDVDLDDDDALVFLARHIAVDLNNSQPINLSRPFSVDDLEAHARLGLSQQLWDEAFVHLNASEQPLSIVTNVVDGVPQTKFQTQIGDPDIYLRNDLAPGIEMDDWIIRYRTSEGLDIPRLINDDYFIAIKLTFNAKLYVSSMKLLLSAIDSLAYIEYGEYGQNVFIKWMDAYADLSPLAITADELWELRNGLLHMTNLDSRKVQTEKVRRISFHIGLQPYIDCDGTHSFSFYELIQIMARSLPKWLESYNKNPSKLIDFVKRYDRTISDRRQARVIDAEDT
jgi:hypothetical protein